MHHTFFYSIIITFTSYLKLIVSCFHILFCFVSSENAIIHQKLFDINFLAFKECHLLNFNVNGKPSARFLPNKVLAQDSTDIFFFLIRKIVPTFTYYSTDNINKEVLNPPISLYFLSIKWIQEISQMFTDREQDNWSKAKWITNLYTILNLQANL